MRKSIFLSALCFVALSIACTKLQESPDPVTTGQDPTSNPTDLITDYSSLKNYYDKNEVVPQTFNGSADQIINLTTKAGIEVEIPAASLTDLSGNPVSGPVQITVEEYNDYEAMLKDQVTTATTDNVLLQSAGMFNIQVKQGSNTLRLKTGSTYDVSFPTSDPDMRAYSGKKLADGYMVWEEETRWLSRLDTGRMRTLFSPDSFRFVNLDKPIIANNPVDQTFKFDPEDEVSDFSASLYLKDRRTAARVNRQANGEITVHPNFQLPGGEQALITILLVKDGYVYWYDTSFTLGDSPSITIPKLSRITKDDFAKRSAYLKTF